LVAEDLLYLQQVDTRFNKMGGIAVAQTVWRNSFLNHTRGRPGAG
jgi:hypothetical protein